MPKMPLPPAESMALDSLAEVARGGMGSVELARVLDGRLAGQILAVKRLHANIAEDPEFVSMFLDEAWMTAALKHNNVAQVVAWGNDDKGMFLAIELVQGVSLSRLLKEAQQNQEMFAERTVAFICSQICGALVAAHTLTMPDGTPLGLVHRDLTPANVLISFDGLVKIIDFGIAKAEERISHTRTGQLKGKPAYMAPEQQRGGAVDARADLFSFGVLMFEMLAGRRPWTSKGAFDVMMEISNDPHPDLGELRKGLNPEFVAIAHRCLEKKPGDRFQTAAEIKARLDAWLDAKGFSSDDQHSLAQFVLRNSQPQVLWWQEALRGEHAKKKKPTFKELEEKIDEERERQAKAARRAAGSTGAPPPPRPAAGMPAAQRAPAKISGTVPMQAYRPDTGAPPSSGQVPASGGNPPSTMGGEPPKPPEGKDWASLRSAQPSSGSGPSSPSLMGVAPSSLRGPGSGPQPGGNFGSGQYAAQQPPSAARPLSAAGTEFMAISPFAQGDPPKPGPPPDNYPASQRYGAAPVTPPASAPPGSGASPYGPPSPHVPSSGGGRPIPPTAEQPAIPDGTIPMAPGLAMANTTQPMTPEMVAALGIGGAPGASPRPGAPAPSAPRRSRLPLVIVIVLVVLGGAGAGLWFFGDRLGLDLGALGLPSAPAGHR